MPKVNIIKYDWKVCPEGELMSNKHQKENPKMWNEYINFIKPPKIKNKVKFTMI